ncbi:alpha/beta-hydrolase [Thozetella sp. PMI_491]|nr:alpha/beta-hydrolase [Thozetella sp. PMI_491]
MGSITDSRTTSGLEKFGSDQRFATKPCVTDPDALEAEQVALYINELIINGFASQESLVANFRNIPYARVPARWHQAIPIDPTKEKGSLEATQYALGKGGRGLPVLVWIHGGAFVYGDGGCEFDGQYLVRRSINLGEPILVVGLNYRLGILGFLASKELREEARSRGEVGFNNLGLHDQRVALQWIQQNIHFFGGDGSRLTVAGESAGAISIIAHLRSRVPLFQNAFIMSPAMLIPAPVEEVQGVYNNLVSKLGLSEAPAGQQLATLRSLSPEELHRLTGDRDNILSEDDEFFSDWADQKWEEITTLPSWVRRVAIGLTKDENILFAQRWAAMSAEEMYREWESVYGDPNYAQEVFTAYNITIKSTQAELLAGYVAYTSDAMFDKAVHSIATTHLRSPHPANPKIYLYSFDQPDVLSPNPVFYGGAYHSQDNAFLFQFPQVAGPSAPVKFQATSDTFSSAVLQLIHGKEPWEDVSVSRKFMSFNAEESRLKDEAEGPLVRWDKLVGTEERLKLFMKGKDLMYRAMAYAMALPVDTHR